MPPAARKAPNDLQSIRNSVIEWSEKSLIHDSGNTVTRWNRA